MFEPLLGPRRVGGLAQEFLAILLQSQGTFGKRTLLMKKSRALLGPFFAQHDTFLPKLLAVRSSGAQLQHLPATAFNVFHEAFAFSV